MLRLLLLVLALGIGAFYLLRFLDRRRRDRLAVVRSGFLVTRAEGANSPPGSEVALRGGAVRLRIPSGWTEEYPDREHAAFRDPANPGRVLRIACELAAGEERRALLEARAGDEATQLEELAGGGLLLKSLEPGREPGYDTLVFRWLTALAASPSRTRLTSFALSLPEAAAFDPLSRELVAFVEREVRAARGGAEP